MSKICLFFALFILMAVFPSEILAKPGKTQTTPTISKGDTAELPQLEYVRVVNLEPVSIPGKTVQFGDQCSLRADNQIVVVGTHKGRVLLRYRLHERKWNTGCPDETIFFFKKEQYLRIVQQNAAKKRAVTRERALVRRLLRKE